MAIRLSHHIMVEVLKNFFAPDPQALFSFPLHSRRRTTARRCPLQLLFSVTRFLEALSHGISIQKTA